MVVWAAKTSACVIASLALVVLAGHCSAADPMSRPAADGVFDAFATHPLVGIGDWHGLADEGEFYDTLVKDPRFAAQVGNVVVEFGGAAHQDTLDRYLAGEDVPFAELRKVWSDVVGWYPTVWAVMYLDFFAQVHAVNLKLPPDRRIHVWLGEPAIDWSTIHRLKDLQPYVARRDEHAAEIIERDILARGEKALVIYGGYHFNSLPAAWGDGRPNLKELVERVHPGAFYVIAAYVGFPNASCDGPFEAKFKLARGTLVTAVRGTALETVLSATSCSFGPDAASIGPSDKRPLAPADQVQMARTVSGAAGDALLYLGPAGELRNSPLDPALYLDEAYFKEISRRMKMFTGSPASLDDFVTEGGIPDERYSPW